MIQVIESSEYNEEKLSGWRGFLANQFGILLLPREQERIYEKQRADWVQLQSLMDDAQGEAYPVRFYPIPEEERRKLVQSINYMRHYSLWSLAAIFLGISILGWLWEVGLHLVTYGQFVNRGILHGPWLPIYGAGSTLILTLLYRVRSNPALEFGMAIGLCGFLEYMASLLMELANDGAKWWDYSGYFLNFQGRICAEGLLLFGVGGICIVYIIAPILDNLLDHMDRRQQNDLCHIDGSVFGRRGVFHGFSQYGGRCDNDRANQFRRINRVTDWVSVPATGLDNKKPPARHRWLFAFALDSVASFSCTIFCYNKFGQEHRAASQVFFLSHI